MTTLTNAEVEVIHEWLAGGAGSQRWLRYTVRNLLNAVAADRKRITELEAWARGIMAFEPVEVVKDAFAYDRMVASFQEAARTALEGSDDPS